MSCTHHQVKGMYQALAFAQRIQAEFPEIAEEYRGGKTLSELVKEYDFMNHYQISNPVARTSVHYALIGDKEMNLSGLLDREEATRLGKLHQSTSGLRVTEQRKGTGIGFEAITKERRIEIGRNSGKKTKEKKVGIFGISKEKRKEVLVLATLARGAVPWMSRENSEEYSRLGEIEYLGRLVTTSSFQHTRKPYMGKPNWNKIVAELNELYHAGKPIRTRSAVINTWHELKKGLRT